MIYAAPEKVVIDQLVIRLSHATEGINSVFNALATNPFSLPATQAPLAFDFVSNPSKNFMLGDVDPVDFEQTSAFKYPIMTLSSKRAENQNLQKFTLFSGTVTIALDIYISWLNNNALRDFESYGSCMTAAVFTLFNQARPGFPSDQDWSTAVTYNGGIAVVKSPVKRAANNWMQQLAFTLTFEVDQ